MVPRRPPPRPPVAWWLIGTLAAVSLVAHLLVAAFGPYGIHRDAFLYMAMGEHLRLWHMDFPPLIAIVSRVVRALFGDSIVALRAVPALAGAGLVLAAGLSAREVGGRRFAQGLACLAVLAGGVYLRAAALFQPVVLDQLWWTLGLLCLLRLSRSGDAGDARWWLAFGLVAGLGLLTKFSILIFGASVLVALLATRARRWLATPWPWAAAAIALLIGSPSVAGQINLDVPVIGQMRDLRSAQLGRISPLSFLAEQPLMAPGFFLAVIGLAATAFRDGWQRYRVVAMTAGAAFLVVLLLGGKPYYVAPIYPVLYGLGAVVLEGIAARPWGRLARGGYAAALVAWLALTLPLGLPVLPPPAMEDYQVRLGLADRVTRTNVGGQERIPQDYADMLGWPELVDEVARVYHGLPANDRNRTVILASNYGEAGAIDFHGGKLGLPPARAFVGSYWFFGPGPLPGEVLILVGFDADDLVRYCGDVRAAGKVDHPYAVEEQRDRTIYVCRAPTTTLQAFWPTMKGAN